MVVRCVAHRVQDEDTPPAVQQGMPLRIAAHRWAQGLSVVRHAEQLADVVTILPLAAHTERRIVVRTEVHHARRFLIPHVPLPLVARHQLLLIQAAVAVHRAAVEVSPAVAEAVVDSQEAAARVAEVVTLVVAAEAGEAAVADNQR